MSIFLIKADKRLWIVFQILSSAQERQTRKKRHKKRSNLLLLLVSYDMLLYQWRTNSAQNHIFTQKNTPSEINQTAYLRWLRRLDLNQRPSGYESDEIFYLKCHKKLAKFIR